MDSDIIDVVTGWDSSPVSGGYDGLRNLADQGFTGAVSEGSAWAFVLNGKVIGVFDGDITAFEDADGTAYHAPDPALPLLYAMKETGGETRAEYYTNNTPISAADSTLSSGNFTGYIELSENILSGDYYVVYYGGKSMSVAYVGNSRKLLTGDEAFQRADDEVGIYRVKEGTIDVVDIPETESESEPTPVDTDDQTDEAADAGVTFDADTDAEPATANTAATTDADDVADDPHAESTDEAVTTVDAAAATDEPATEAESVDTSDPVVADPAVADPDVTGPVDADGDEPSATADSAGEQPEPPASVEATDSDTSDSVDTTESAHETDEDPLAASPTAANGAADDDDVFSEEAQWREARSIPALDPQESAPESRADERNGSTAQQSPGRRRDAAARSQRTPQQSQPRTKEATRRRQSVTTSGRNGQQREVSQLKQRLEAVTTAKSKLESEHERLVADRERLTAERDEYREKADELQSRVSTLETEVEELEAELAEVRANGGGASDAPTQTMSREAALDGTNLFVRYGSKSGGTLEKAHAGEVNRSEVNENLRLEHHTGFETEGVVVDGASYEEFLQESIEYGFVRWVVEDLLYEIRETGNRGSLDELFDAIPKVDRAELQGNVTLKYSEGGEEHREQQSFDVVLRDRMGNPLLVANLNGSRDPASEGMMRSLVEHTSRLRESNDSLGAAFLVTASYFAPDALETAADATGGGLLSRGRRKSFVKLSRKQGFHLCLVETRNGDFHVNVPEL